ncbi:MAG: hypothetical protein Q9212_004697 [Teloschistes hypoglaucus]
MDRDKAAAALQSQIHQSDIQILQTESRIRDVQEFKKTLEGALNALQAARQHPLWNEGVLEILGSHQDGNLETRTNGPSAESALPIPARQGKSATTRDTKPANIGSKKRPSIWEDGDDIRSKRHRHQSPASTNATTTPIECITHSTRSDVSTDSIATTAALGNHNPHEQMTAEEMIVQMREAELGIARDANWSLQWLRRNWTEMREGVLSGRMIRGILPVSLGGHERRPEADGEASQA